MFTEDMNYSIEELEIAQIIISLIGEEVPVDEALEVYEEISISLFD